MIDHDSIAPPPSLADILSGGEDLIGRVDFGSRLVPAAEEPARPAARTRAPQVAARSTAQPAVPAEVPATSGPEAETAPATRPAGRAPKATPRTSARATIRPTSKRSALPTDEAPVLTPVAEPELDEVDELDELDEVDEQDEHGLDPYDEPQPRSFTEPAPRPSVYAEDAYSRSQDRRRQLFGPTLTAPSTVPEEDVAYLGLSVDEVAESARARMRAAELAHLRHLEAIEHEAARRLELLTAQAELDAELIRLHARREAHAIITAARARTGAAGGSSRAERHLADVGGSFSRFAETLDSTLESSLAPEHRPHR